MTVELAKAYVAARKEIGLIVHNKKMQVARGVERGYASLDQLIEHVIEPLAKHGLSLSFNTDDNLISASLIHEEGGTMESFVTMPQSSNAKDHWGNITSGRRYALMCLLALSVGEDDAAARPMDFDGGDNQSANNNGHRNNGNGQSNRHDMAIEDRLRDVRGAFSKLMNKTVTDQEIQEMAGVSLRDITHEHIDKLQDVYRDLRAAAQQAAETVGA